MMALQRRLLFSLMVLSTAFLMGCDDNPVRLTILHTNDIHSTLRPAKEDVYGLGGLPRLKTVIDQRRAANSGHPTLLLDAGDFSEGNIIYSLDQGRSMVEALTRMGYDAVVLGNHDFLDGP
jgi:5'-nucleotidase